MTAVRHHPRASRSFRGLISFFALGMVACARGPVGGAGDTVALPDASPGDDGNTGVDEDASETAPPPTLLGDSGAILPPGACPYHDDVDHDGDGFASTDGDCDDCDPDINPGAFDVPADGIDQDCDGIPDDEPTGCDVGATLASDDPFEAALAIDLCRRTTESATGKLRTWGVIDATFVAPDGSDLCQSYGNASPQPAYSCAANANFALGHGNLTGLGVTPPEQGSHMLALSSGTARDPTDPGYQSPSGFDKQFLVRAASGFPAPTPACPGILATISVDGAALQLTIRVPTNARSLSMNENFFSYEFPTYVCSEYDDTFVIEMTPVPSGLANPNIAFDQSGNTLGVNSSLFQVCDPQIVVGTNFPCPLGPSSLQGTGFSAGDSDGFGGDRGATGWLKTVVNIGPELRGKDITLLFAVWDGGDGVLDSTALVDNLVWSDESASSTPVTVPQ
jgi:Putative metal-binding motif